MAIVVTKLGTDQDKDNLRYVQIAPLSGINTGDYLIAVFAGDIAPTLGGSSGYFNESTWENWTQDVIATNAGNVVVSILSVKVVTGGGTIARIYDGDTGTAKAMALYKVTGLAATAFDKSATATGSGDAPTSGPTDTLSQADELVIGAIGMEEQTDEKGTWTTGAGYVSGNDQDAGTTGGGGASNASIFGVAEIVSATIAQEAEQTSTGGNDWAAAIATYKGVAVLRLPRYGFVNFQDPGIV